jgi:hypothetical protein
LVGSGLDGLDSRPFAGIVKQQSTRAGSLAGNKPDEGNQFIGWRGSLPYSMKNHDGLWFLRIYAKSKAFIFTIPLPMDNSSGGRFLNTPTHGNSLHTITASGEIGPIFFCFEGRVFQHSNVL